ncbi:MAG: undecaprenyl-phosphate glucose phosphotransferase [Clostridia bacterium]|nr:undecaprenyl-phosphate glucose phosphotransferase [Clostridia bacterium]
MRQNSIVSAIFNAILDLIINIGAIYTSYLILAKNLGAGLSKMSVAVSTVVAFASVMLYFICDIYSAKIDTKLHKQILKLGGAQLFIVSVVIILIVILIPQKTAYYYLTLVSAVMSYLVLSLKHIIVVKATHATRKNKRRIKTVLIVGNSSSGKEYEKQINENPHLGFEIIGCVCDAKQTKFKKLGGYSELDSVIKEYNPSEVVLALSSREEGMIEHLISICDNNGIRTAIIPQAYRYFKSKCQVDMIGNMPIINTRDIPLDNIANAVMKRVMDIIVSLIVIILTSPIMLFAMIGVKLSSPGPVIFKQKRVGKNNEIFTMYKFRSMKVNEMQDTGWTTNDDPRKTRFGTFLRKTGIDELPQFFNVLFGSMSIIGPRPELPNFVEEYSKTIPLYKVKHQVKPGITGLAQIYGFRGDTSIERRIELDIKYIEDWSIFNDIKILFVTPFKMFNRNEKYVK